MRTDFQQAALGANVALDLVPFRATHGAQQDSVGRTGALKGLVGQRYAMLVDGCAADQVVGQLQAQVELVTGQLQHLDRFGHDFRTNTVARENQNLLAHGFLFLVC